MDNTTRRYCYDCGADATVLLPVGEMDRETGYVDERGYCDDHGPEGPVAPILAPSSSPYFALAVGLARTMEAK